MAKVLWFTGLSGSGKSTIADHLKEHVGNCVLLDGDVTRGGLNKDLGFSVEDRNENIRRIAEVAKIIYESNITALVTFISPIAKQRQFARNLIGKDFIEIHVSTSLEECERRDVKGLYKKARSGEIPMFTGIDSPYEAPENPEIYIDTKDLEVEDCTKIILDYINIVDTKVPHDVFVGRWCPFHKGHFAIMKKRYEETKNPLLILVRDTSFDEKPAEWRAKVVEHSMKTMNIPATVLIIPDIKSINWGRGVGYETNLVDVDEEIKNISGTEIRKMKANGDNSWEDLVCPGVPDFYKD